MALREAVQMHRNHEGRSLCMCWLDDETGLAVGGEDGFINVWGATVNYVVDREGGAAHVAIAGSGDRIAAGARARALSLGHTGG